MEITAVAGEFSTPPPEPLPPDPLQRCERIEFEKMSGTQTRVLSLIQNCIEHKLKLETQ